ncbi:MAG: hypothetical protein H6811_03680 [Phycisphaeraceae bacterium]|nr:hypothetical protein [Phycisphaeraceae bacterium]
MPIARRSRLGVLVALLTAGALGQNGPVEHAASLRGHKIVRVIAQTEAQVEMLDDLGLLYGERMGIGENEFVLSPEALARVIQEGMEIEIVHDDVQALIDAERAEIERRRALRDITWFENYHTYAEIMSYLNQLAADHPALASVATIGQSLQARDIRAIEITGPGDSSNRPVVFFNGLQHAREWISPATVMFTIEQLLTGYGSDSRITALLDRVKFKIVPITNPDGYEYTWTDQRLWRKNRRNNGGGSFGVDLNRNWGKEWGGDGSSGNPGSDTYRGTSAFSEPETQVLRDYVLADPNIIAHVDFHSYSQLILWPWGYADVPPPEPDRTFFDDFSVELSNIIESVHGTYYTPEQSIDLYAAAGNASDWTYSVGVYGWTIELRPNNDFVGFELPPDEIIPTGEEIFQAVLAIGEQFGFPLRISLPQGELVSVDAGVPTTLDVNIQEITDTVASAELKVRYDVIASETSYSLASVGGSSYEATIPGLGCGRSFGYHIEVTGTSGEAYRYPATGELTADARSLTVVSLDDVETDAGWTVGAAGDDATTGIWGRMDPQGTQAQPENDHTPAPGTMCWITDGRAGTGVGTYDVDNGTTTLTGPILDTTEPAGWKSAGAWIEYARWYSNDQGSAPNADSMPVSISSDGGSNWTTLEDVSENANDWVVKSFRVSDFVTPGSQTRLRFQARDLGSGSIVEAGVDDVRVLIRGCQYAPADFTRDGSVDGDDFFAFLDLFASGDPLGDLNGDGVHDATDFFAFLDLFIQG